MHQEEPPHSCANAEHEALRDKFLSTGIHRRVEIMCTVVLVKPKDWAVITERPNNIEENKVVYFSLM